MPRPRADRQIGDERIFSFAGSMRDYRAVAGLLRHRHSFERFADRADLIEFDENGVGDAVANALCEDFRIGNEIVIADELQFLAERLR